MSNRSFTWESHSSSSWPLWSDARLSDDSWRVIGPGLPGGIAGKKEYTRMIYLKADDSQGLVPSQFCDGTV